MIALRAFGRLRDAEGRRILGARCGVYAFFDFDGEPIYVGKTRERLSARIGRHLTNQRTDAVAMHVLDPLEVATVRVWPLWELEHAEAGEQGELLARAEYAAYRTLIEQSPIGRILNEKAVPEAAPMELPAYFDGSLVPPEDAERLAYPDIRIARRAHTIANLAQVISERDVSLGLRETLLTQAQRLERLANTRLHEIRDALTPEQIEQETVGDDQG